MVILSSAWASFVLRLVLGIEFIFHGYPKLFQNFNETSEMLKNFGFYPSNFWALILGLTEFIGGIFLLIGLMTRLTSSLLIIVMVTATLIKIFSIGEPFTHGDAAGWEWDLVIIAGLISIFLLGSGALAIDQILNLSINGFNLG